MSSRLVFLFSATNSLKASIAEDARTPFPTNKTGLSALKNLFKIRALRSPSESLVFNSGGKYPSTRQDQLQHPEYQVGYQPILVPFDQNSLKPKLFLNETLFLSPTEW